jgi:hypothetical protein
MQVMLYALGVPSQVLPTLLRCEVPLRKVSPGAPECHLSYLEASHAELEVYARTLFELLVSEES